MAIATLSIDLEARLARLEGDLGRATSLVERQAGRMEKSFSSAISAAKGIGAGLISGLGAAQVGQLLRNTAEYAQRVERLSALSNQSAQDFQRQAEAARTVGIESDKLGDIYKDVQDKVGDFLQVGGGPLKDFFEQIAPRVGVTAEQFRKLGGADALQLYVNSLEDANLSQAEMTFYLEAIASDSTLLLPLLRNNGAAFKELGDQAERTGVIMDTKALAAAQEYGRNLQELDRNVSSLARSIAGPLITSLNDLFALQARGQKSGGGFFTGYFDKLKEDFVGARGTALQEEVDRQRPGFERAQGILASQPDSIRAKATVAEFREAEKAAADYRAELDRIRYGGGSRRPANEGGGRVNIPLLPLPPKPPKGPAGRAAAAPAVDRGPVGPEIPEALAASLKRIEGTDTQRLERLNEQLRVLVDLAAGGNTGAVQALPELVEEITALDPAAREAATRLEEFNKQKARLDQLLAGTPQGKLESVTEEIDFLNRQFAAGNISSVEQWAAAVRNATQGLGQQTEKVGGVAEELGISFKSAAEEAIVNFSSVRDVLKGLEQDVLRIFARKLVTEPLANAATSFLSGLFPSANGNAFGPAGVMAFAAGGVVDRPTLFGFGGNRTGLMGEAGPEAILPLRRGRDGQLGVSGAGGGSVTNITVNVQAAPGMSRDTAQQQGVAYGRGIQQALARNA